MVLELWRQGHCLALFCIEENPWRCHRGTRIAPALVARGARVVHIRGDGRLEEHPPMDIDAPFAFPFQGETR